MGLNLVVSKLFAAFLHLLDQLHGFSLLLLACSCNLQNTELVFLLLFRLRLLEFPYLALELVYLTLLAFFLAYEISAFLFQLY